MNIFPVSPKKLRNPDLFLIKTLLLTTVLLSAFCSLTNRAFADTESNTQPGTERPLFSETDSTLVKTGKVLGLTALTGGVLYFDAWAAKEYPVAVGGSLVLLSPLAASDKLNDWGNATLVAGVIGIGLYNLRNTDDDTHSENDRFRRTFYSLPLIVVAAKSIDYVTGGTEKKSDDISADLKIGKGQELLVLTWRF